MKSFEPTPARLDRARREGDHPISRDLVAVAAFCGALIGLAVLFQNLRSTIPADFRQLLGGTFAARLYVSLGFAVTLACAGASIAAILATAAQTHGLHFRPLECRLHFARVLGLEGLAAALRAALLFALGTLGVALVMHPVPRALGPTLGVAICVGIASALVDVLLVQRAWRRRLRMSHDELRRDLREHDGDPQLRARRKRMHRSLSRGGLSQMRRASFVVVNPTHIAIALRYAPPEVPVPEILVRAAESSALRVRTLASELRIPIVENPDLARQLYAQDAFGPIAPELYLAVARIIAALQQRT